MQVMLQILLMKLVKRSTDLCSFIDFKEIEERVILIGVQTEQGRGCCCIA